MIDGIEAVTTSAVALALDAASLRQQAIAANIANANAVGYTRQQVSFEDQLGAARRSLASDGSIDGMALAAVRPRIEAASHADGVPVQLDVEVGQLAQNGLQYQALIKGLNRQFAILNSAVSDGRR